jgi:hypothetical protein
MEDQLLAEAWPLTEELRDQGDRGLAPSGGGAPYECKAPDGKGASEGRVAVPDESIELPRQRRTPDDGGAD